MKIASRGRRTALAVLAAAACGSCGHSDPVLPVYDSTQGYAIGDLDGDGRADLVVGVARIEGAPPHAGWLRVRLSRASAPGGFDPPVDLPVGPDPFYVAIADLDGDGHPDFASASATLSASGPAIDRVVVRRQDPGRRGTFGPAIEFALGGASVAGLVVGDLDADGRPDVVLATGSATPGVAVLWGDASVPGGLSAPQWIVTGLHASSPSVADLDGDGRPEIVFLHAGSAYAASSWTADPRRFAAPVALAPSDLATAVATADLDGDGRLDLVVADRATTDVGARGVLRTFAGVPGSSPARFRPLQVLPLAVRSWTIAVCDLDGNGRPDVLAAEPIAGALDRDLLEAFLADPASAGTLRTAVTTEMRKTHAYGMAVGDLDGDGLPDVATGHLHGVAILRQRADPAGSFSEPIVLP